MYEYDIYQNDKFFNIFDYRYVFENFLENNDDILIVIFLVKKFGGHVTGDYFVKHAETMHKNNLFNSLNTIAARIGSHKCKLFSELMHEKMKFFFEFQLKYNDGKFCPRKTVNACEFLRNSAEEITPLVSYYDNYLDAIKRFGESSKHFSLKKDNTYISFFLPPMQNGQTIGIVSQNKLSVEMREKILQLIFNTIVKLHHIEYIRKSIRTAMSAIMARNGSHNIGSHVLAALSHNVGTMPDDRILYQYIQHRMDYIATVTTEQPNWTKPTKFVGDIMKEFFSQHHLLEYIAKSEGLSAYQFQHHNHDLTLIPNFHKDQKGKIKIFIRKIFPHCPKCLTDSDCNCFSAFDEHNAIHVLKTEINEHNFIDYVSDSKIDLGHDVDVAIPGGVVGKHAFYTILENIIRNAAKHGWSKNKKHMEDNLEIYIDFCENFEDTRIDFTIWDNMSSIFSHPKLAEHEYISQTIVLNLQPIIERKSLDCKEVLMLVDLNNKLIGLLENSTNIETSFEAVKHCAEEIKHTDLREIYDRFVIKPIEQIFDNGNMSIDKINHIENSINKLNIILNEINTFGKISVTDVKSKIELLKLFKKCEFSEKLNFDYLFAIEILQFLITNICVEEKILNQVFKTIADMPKISHVFKNLDLESSLEIKFIDFKKIFTEHNIKLGNYTNDIRQINHSIVKILDSLIELDVKEKSIFKKIDILLAKYANSNENYAENITLLEQKQYQSTFKKHFSDIVPTNEKISGIKDNIEKIIETMPTVQKGNSLEEKAKIHDLLEEEIFNLIEQEEILAQQEELVANDVEKVDFVFFTHSLSCDEKEAIKILKEKDSNVRLPLHWQQQLLLDKPFIGESGELRKENWGLYEMKISAGFLSRLSIARIGGLSFDDEDSTKSTLRPNEAIITPVAMPGICRKSSDNHAIQCQNDLTCDCQKRFHLGYQFSIPKSKEILIIVNDENKIPTDQTEYNKEGIYFREENHDSIPKQDFAFEYVIIPENNDEKILSAYKTNCPYRLLQNNGNAHDIGCISNEKLFSEDGRPQEIEKLKIAVYTAWTEQLKNIRKIPVNEELKILLQVDDNNSNKAGQGLVTNKDILKFLFKENVRSVIKEFYDIIHSKYGKLHNNLLEKNECESCNIKYVTLKIFQETMYNLFNENHFSYGKYFSNEKHDISVISIMDYKEVSNSSVYDRHVKRAIKSVVKDIFANNSLSDDDIISNVFENWNNEINDKEIDDATINALNKIISNTDDITSFEIKKYIEELKDILTNCFIQAFKAIEVLLRKYEEHVVTLPKGYSYKTETTHSGNNKKLTIGATLFSVDSGEIKIKYLRHSRLAAKYYSEALSGTQSYLNTLDNLWKSNEEVFCNGFITKIIENSLLRILIIDERMANFLIERTHLISNFSHMNIFVMDVERKCNITEDDLEKFRNDSHELTSLLPVSDNYLEWLSKEEDDNKKTFTSNEYLEWLNENKKTNGKNFLRSIQFDAVIIHQGVIDKWLIDKSQKNVENFIKKMQAHTPMVLITTGRGTPENIPDTVKMIPFSSLENSMFKQYPEKLILVDTIMNALPKGEKI